MMDRKDNIPTDDRNIEDMLRPRCEFHASPQLYARIISEAMKQSYRKPWYKKWKAISTSAAAVAAIILGTVVGLHHDWHHSSPGLALTTDSDIPSQSIMEIPETPVITEGASSQADDTHEEVRIKKIYRNSASVRKNLNANNVISSKNVADTQQTFTSHADAADGERLEFAELPAGPMPQLAKTEAKVAKKTTLTTDECDEYVSMLRAAYMNNIERMREEVAETKTFIQEMRVNCTQNLK